MPGARTKLRRVSALGGEKITLILIAYTGQLEHATESNLILAGREVVNNHASPPDGKFPLVGHYKSVREYERRKNVYYNHAKLSRIVHN